MQSEWRGEGGETGLERECLECHFRGAHSIRSSRLHNEKNFDVQSHAHAHRVEQYEGNDMHTVARKFTRKSLFSGGLIQCRNQSAFAHTSVRNVDLSRYLGNFFSHLELGWTLYWVHNFHAQKSIYGIIDYLKLSATWKPIQVTQICFNYTDVQQSYTMACFSDA